MFYIVIKTAFVLITKWYCWCDAWVDRDYFL